MQHVISQLPVQLGSEFQPTAIQQAAGGFSGAGVFQIECSAGKFALRLWPSESLPAERILGLHRLLHSVFAAGVTQVAAPVIGLQGVSLQQSNDQLWHLEPWREGIADFHEHPSQERIDSAFACLARWHQVARTFTPTAAEAPWFSSRESSMSPAAEERLSLLRSWMHQDELHRVSIGLNRAAPNHRHLFDRAIRQCEQHAESIANQLHQAMSLRVDIQPCLRDIWHDHLLFSDEQLTGLIDCNACRTESVASDLARLLGSLFGDDHTSRTAALAAYQSHRKLTTDELVLTDVLDRSGTVISAMHWVREFAVKAGKSDNQDQPHRGLDRLATFVDRMENDFGSSCGELLVWEKA